MKKGAKESNRPLPGTLWLQPVSEPVAYFNVTFAVTSSSGQPLVICNITCPDGLVSSITAPMTGETSFFPVPVPGYNGKCVASVEADDYLPAFQNITVMDFTQCRATIVSTPKSFNQTTNATITVSHPLSGPIGSIIIANDVSPSNGFLTYNSFQGQISTIGMSQIYYQSNCTDSATLGATFTDYAQANLTDCSAYGDYGEIQPFTPFRNFNGIQAQDPINVTIFLSPTAPNNAAGQLNSLSSTICLASNYLVVNSSSSFVPSSSYSFAVSLGLNQSMSTQGAATFTCGSDTTTITFTLTNSPQFLTIDTPTASAGSQCIFYIYNNPDYSAYVAPTNLYLTAEALTIEALSTTAVAGTDLPYKIYLSSDPQGQYPTTVTLYCSNTLLASQNTNTSNAVQTFPIPADAVGVCQFNATNSNNTVDVTVNQQLYVASSLTGWTGGSSVQVNISSLNLATESITMSSSCSIGSFTCQVNTSSNSLCSIPSNVNGVQCSLTTTNLPQYYLPINPTFVNIAISQSQIAQIIQQINPSAFLSFSYFRDPVGGLLKRFKARRAGNGK